MIFGPAKGGVHDIARGGVGWQTFRSRKLKVNWFTLTRKTFWDDPRGKGKFDFQKSKVSIFRKVRFKKKVLM